MRSRSYFPPYSFPGFDLRTADEAQSSEDGERLGASVAAVTLPARRGDTPRGALTPARPPIRAVGFRRAFTPQEQCRSKAEGEPRS